MDNSYKFDSVKLLIVEDNEPMMRLVQSIMQSFGCVNIHTAISGLDGLNAYNKVNPDLIIADWMMNPMDGITMTERIRRDTRGPNLFVPIILMTGFSQRHRVEEARDSGVTEFLVKPFNVNDMYKRIVQVIEKPRKFVKADEFFGPDRRRKEDGDYVGAKKRSSDEASTFYVQ